MLDFNPRPSMTERINALVDAALIAEREATPPRTYLGASRLGHRRNPDEVKRDGWKEQGLLAVAIDDDRLTWPERELVRQLGERLYGKREREARHG
ncbi:MAG: hypothetical protein CVT86_00985 [Alphaproteobacteria bacterium HGW-Alphaproteobacteria-8]|jgi:hypothetical protein|nr:MAG: hypothetical protein CVT86_00985 [Alphaproteobacteria bacterium HGW-Alphaproteobacteria-8]